DACWLQGELEFLDGQRISVLVRVKAAEVEMGKRIRRFDVQRSAVKSRSLVPFSFPFQNDRPVVERLGMPRVEARRLLKSRFRFSEPLPPETKDTKIVVDLGPIRIKCNGFPISCFRLTVPVKTSVE